jgi:hypothetical protein
MMRRLSASELTRAIRPLHRFATAVFYELGASRPPRSKGASPFRAMLVRCTCTLTPSWQPWRPWTWESGWSMYSNFKWYDLHPTCLRARMRVSVFVSAFVCAPQRSAWSEGGSSITNS